MTGISFSMPTSPHRRPHSPRRYLHDPPCRRDGRKIDAWLSSIEAYLLSTKLNQRRNEGYYSDEGYQVAYIIGTISNADLSLYIMMFNTFKVDPYRCRSHLGNHCRFGYQHSSRPRPTLTIDSIHVNPVLQNASQRRGDGGFNLSV
jgi:hypothetical protein